MIFFDSITYLIFFFHFSEYCQYASNIKYRCQWDKNVAEARQIETIEDGVDIAYVATNRIGALYPRDYIVSCPIYSILGC